MKKRIFFICMLFVLVCSFCGCSTTKKIKYTTAISQLDSGKYDKAKQNFEELGDYEDAAVYADECDYKHAIKCMEEEKFEEASELLLNISDYSTAMDMYTECQYHYAGQLVEKGEYEEAKEIYTNYITYEDSAMLLLDCNYKYAQSLIAGGQHKKALKILKELEDYLDSQALYEQSAYIVAKNYYKSKSYYEAFLLFDELGSYKKSKKYLKKISSRSKPVIYKKAVETYEGGDMKRAKELFKGTKRYKDSKDYLAQIELYQHAQGTWVCQTPAMRNIGSKYTLVITGWEIEVTIRQGYTTDNKESSYSYTMSTEKYKGKCCLHYGEDTYFYKDKKLLKTFRDGKKRENYKKL